MTSQATTSFPVAWRDPADAGLTWFRDPMHFPAPVTPLTSAFLRECLEPGVAAACEAMVSPLATLRHTAFNGWVYNSPVLAVPPGELGARMEQHMPVMGDHMDNLGRRWETEYLPAVRRLTDEIESLDFSGDADSARAALDRLVEIEIEIWRIHFLVVFPKLAAGERFSGIYTQVTGTTEEMEPYRCLQGIPNKSLEADRALWDLAQEARRTPAVAQALAGGTPGAALDALDHSPEGRAWRERFEAFLAEYGHRAQALELAAPTWIEEPSFAVENLRRYLAAEAADPEGQRAAHLAEAEALVDAARARIGDDAGLRAAFDHALDTARAAWPLEEDHAFHIDQRSLAGATRRAFQRLAVDLVGRGRLGATDDVWYLDLDALRDGVAGADLTARAQAGRRAHAEDSLLEAPPLLGVPPDPDAPVDPGLTKFFGTPGPPVVEGAVLRGSAGSRGRVEGVARVVRSVDELHLVQPGEILVCRSTTPPWTPVFASIAGLVTDTGGVLAHGAIVAREYAIPAVMGTKIATQVIADGQRITVDGDAGEVLIA
ncbi:PEP-utilizing enzyme [Miltoncostaea oceani]|uniref:PEP-utilizing enzyme n=1 Tax=Miltoncostaea oceani TaxID=2843216 RepID=UPI001C3C9B9C|nr:PEP-utilizing enzyme [Miltoncostaea oceani]